MPIEGLVSWPSRLDSARTLERLRAAIGAAGLTLFAHVDHAAAAKAVGLKLQPLNLLIFGSPRAGTPLMAVCPTLGIDLPLKALVWQDEAGAVWLSFNSPAWLALRHHLPEGFGKITGAMASLQTDLAARASFDEIGALR